MRKGLEELEKIKSHLEIIDGEDGEMWGTGEYEEEEALETIEKELKALKFIVKKLGIRVSKSNSILDRKNTCYLYTKDKVYVISIKNYELLKEVLL